MTEIRALVVDDEPHARENVCALLRREPSWRVIGECANAAALEAALEIHTPDVVFLDIRLPGANGVALARVLRDRTPRPLVVFTTAYETYAVEAFDVEASRQDRVPLAWELDFVTNYLELQQMRFGNRLQFVIHQTTISRSCDVPPLLLQPLIENAVVHGVARTSEPVQIDVRVSTETGELRVEVDNTRDVGASIDREPGHQSTGVGLRNTRQRLERLYGEAFVLDAGPDGPERYRVMISLPHAVAYA